MRRLALGLPTVLQVFKPKYAVLFHERGTVGFKHLGLQSPPGFGQDLGSRRLKPILLESCTDIQLWSGPFFTVEAACAHEHSKWVNAVPSEWFYMKTWSFSEFLQASVALSFSKLIHLLFL